MERIKVSLPGHHPLFKWQQSCQILPIEKNQSTLLEYELSN